MKGPLMILVISVLLPRVLSFQPRLRSTNEDSDDDEAAIRIRTLNHSLSSEAKFLRSEPSFKKTFELVPNAGKKHNILATVVVRNFLSVSLAGGIGKCYAGKYGMFHESTPLPRTVSPGSQEAFMVIQSGNSRGTSGTAEWRVTLGGERLLVRLVWSVPYSFVFYKSKVGVEVARRQRDLDDSFDDIYDTKSASEGELKANHTLGDVFLYGQMDPGKTQQRRVVFTVASLDPDMMHDFEAAAARRKGSRDDDGTNKMALISVIFIAILVASAVIFCVLLVCLACCLLPCCHKGSNQNHNNASAPVANGWTMGEEPAEKDVMTTRTGAGCELDAPPPYVFKEE